ncbi:16S rRNA (cytosine(1402)-N(4))-methyltransferase RsmH [Roseiarcaceae bacterium H3SJ34-1]|uniref:16S rRNA (cytosine(1402)-N(4))-methyltransferase RsmH n=1 Tax=Terripilifer ovatus TaxID=3032367 RepID=UPI003AB9327D|nr:16S rRNA (cytosine(1402)-N(4))-methyltransferase RsmH [Roseiarcaceae bacterium H3SJ34-1]
MKPGRGNESSVPDGGLARHVPVLLEAVLNALKPEAGGLFLDATFGAGGYSRAILKSPDVRLLALDRDPSAIRDGQALVTEMAGRLTLEQARFGEMVAVADRLGLGRQFDGVVLDIGVSSMQIDEAERGFSFRLDGPLDMRMGQSGRSAADIVNTASAEELADILYYFGEERQSRRIAKAIVEQRAVAPLTTTRALADLVQKAAPAKPTQIHPATRTFQALRIAVNDELGELVRALVGAEALLKPGGRLVVVSFHSLEDRIVKQYFAERSNRGRAKSRLLPGEIAPPPAAYDLPSGQPVIADDAETARNPRARSAKLRVGVRTQAPASPARGAFASQAALPQREPKRG